jgi:hypothetical protein
MRNESSQPIRCGCGGEAKIDWTIINGAFMAGVICSKCGVKTAPVWDRYDKDKAISEAVKVWNLAMSGIRVRFHKPMMKEIE